MISRRRLIQLGGAGVLALPSFLEARPDARKFYFAVIADTHIIDGFYKGPENSPEDTESIFKTTERLIAARDTINGLRPAMDLVFLVGDYFHDYPSVDLDFYFQNRTRIDEAKALSDGFTMPVHVGFGNHDYAVPKVSREATHELFRRKLSLQPYYSVEHRGFKFVHLNNFLGDTWQAGHARFDKKQGSLGEAQLNWFEAELRQGKPTFVFIHFPLTIVAAKEREDYGLLPLLKQHKDTVQRVVSGHWHRWFEFGRSFGPQHLVMAATRYDPNAYLIVEVDTQAATHRLLNLDLVDWNTHFSRPYQRS
jgi:predicted MPP superfamily phosphohydrolase